MFKRHFSFIVMACLLGCGSPLSVFAQELTDLRKLVDDARLTFERFVRNPGNSWLQDNVKHAKGVFLIPTLGEAGYIVGGSLGNAVLLLQDEKTGAWSDPAFYRLVGGTFGLQIGASKSQVLGLVMTQRGVDSLLSSTFLLGAGATVAVGPVGGGISGGSLTEGRNGFSDVCQFRRGHGELVPGRHCGGRERRRTRGVLRQAGKS